MTYDTAHNTESGENWAQSHTFGAEFVQHPTDLEEVQKLVTAGGPVRALGTRHSFTDLADTAGRLISVDGLPLELVIDSAARTASFAPGIRYGDLATELQSRGWALHNLASLPHISVAGAVATGTHGSGDRNGTLSSAVAGIEFVDGRGELVQLTRGDDDFDGAVVALGALGVATRITLDIEPTFDVRQDLYRDLPWDAALEHFDEISSSAYSVSLFPTWANDTIETVWLKSRMDEPAPPEELFGAPALDTPRHMIADQPASNTTQQGGVPGPWNERLAHFKLGFTPSNGDELQSEYLVPRAAVHDALERMRALASRITPLLHITEIRTMSQDRLWLSGAYDTDAVGIHFTWKKLPVEVGELLPDIEAALLPLGARPHWGKVFSAEIDSLEPLYPRLRDFRRLVEKYDPDGIFHNGFLERKLGL